MVQGRERLDSFDPPPTHTQLSGGRISPAAAAGAEEGEGPGCSSGGGGLLWVNKYAPHSFTSLLSDEATNREVAKWVKSWEKPGGPTVAGSGGFGQPAGRPAFGNGGSGSFGGRGIEQKAERVVLIAGPPGGLTVRTSLVCPLPSAP